MRLLESVITNTSDSILITEAEPIDSPGPKIIYVNEAFEKMTGYSRDEVIGKSPRILQGLKTDRSVLDKLRGHLEKWEPVEVEVINYKKSGEEFWINMAIAPVADSKGWFTHWISIERDVTDRRNQLIELEIKNEKLSEIAWIQSHIVRAPLARLLGLINLLKSDSNIKLEEVVDHIQKSSQELDGILRQIVSKTEEVNINNDYHT